MKTSLPIGTWISFTYRGQTDHALLIKIDEKIAYQLGTPPKGAEVQPCVWKKGDILEPRGKPTVKALEKDDG